MYRLKNRSAQYINLFKAFESKTVIAGWLRNNRKEKGQSHYSVSAGNEYCLSDPKIQFYSSLLFLYCFKQKYVRAILKLCKYFTIFQPIYFVKRSRTCISLEFLSNNIPMLAVQFCRTKKSCRNTTFLSSNFVLALSV